jgi:hypothetical protein
MASYGVSLAIAGVVCGASDHSGYRKRSAGRPAGWRSSMRPN